MILKRYYDDEIWREIPLQFPFCEKYKLQVSNYGNLNRLTIETLEEKILSQSLTEGYPASKFTMLTKMDEKDNLYFIEIRNYIEDLKRDIKETQKEFIKCDGRDALFYDLTKKIEESESLLETIKKNYLKKYKQNERSRKKTFGDLIHRLVAITFIEKPSEKHNLVAHLDYNKLNNHVSNLKWMTREENTLHQKSSPFVIKSKKEAIGNRKRTNTKLTESKVMIIKKRINENVPLRTLAKNFKVSETQLLRIKRGINWGKVQPAK
jgi:HNH endonuclease